MKVKQSEKWLKFLEQQNKRALLYAGFGLVAILGFIDALTGYEAAFSVFYLIPVSLVSYFVSRPAGLCICFMAAGAWMAADLAAGATYSNPFTPYWNTSTRFAFFTVTALLLSSLRTAFEHEKELARNDFLTGAANSRSFYEVAEAELHRSRRYSRLLSVVHMDVDNFKAVNDTRGHKAGDDLLRIIVKTIQAHVRETDVVARLGGDEFALLLPETGQEGAQVLVQKIQKKLMEELKKENWPVSFSIGLLTCIDIPPSVDELLNLADKLTYAAKNDGKNTIKQGVTGAELAVNPQAS